MPKPYGNGVSDTNEFCVSPFLDGYDLEQVIPAVPDMWPDVLVRFRPLSADDESQAYFRYNVQGVPLVRAFADVIAGDPDNGVPRKILGWDLKDRNGKLVPISSQNLGKLRPGFFDALKAVLYGVNPAKPEENETEADVKNS